MIGSRNISSFQLRAAAPMLCCFVALLPGQWGLVVSEVVFRWSVAVANEAVRSRLAQGIENANQARRSSTRVSLSRLSLDDG